jgi:hypothetical protein
MSGAKGKEQSAKDSEGKELQVGDQVVVRGRVIGIPVKPLADLPALIQVEWESGAPLLNFVRSTSVRKESDQ